MNWNDLRAQMQSRFWGRLLLGTAALGYGAAVLGRRLLYRFKVLPRKRLKAKVICIGNLTTGGTGKTPAVLLAAETLRGRGQEVAILSRGHGRAGNEKDVVVLLDGRRTDWQECGDEPWMIHQSLLGQGVPVLVCSDRVKAGELAIDMYNSKVLILDDGFQHLKLQRNVDIVLINARDPFGGGRLLPLGNLREPISALKRAQVAVITHADLVAAPELARLRDQIDAAHPGMDILEATHEADYLLDVRAEQKRPLSYLKGKAVVAVSGLGDPASFESSLESLGTTLAQRWRYPDHHVYSEAEMRSVSDLRGELPLVTTFKDFVRLPPRWRELLSGEVFVLSVRLNIRKGRGVWFDTLDKLATRVTHRTRR